MLNYFLPLLFIFLHLNISHSQNYQNQNFDEVELQTHKYLKTDKKNLHLDIYQPVGDDRITRPVILFVHGGGFAGGARDEPEIKEFCNNMAKRGIVAVSMSYTLTMKGRYFNCGISAKDKLVTFKKAGIEINEATNYLIENQNELRINPDSIVLAGSSAGAEAALHAAYWPKTMKPLPQNFKYAGLISMAGAIYNLDFITKETAIPMQLFHGTCDTSVPYGSASHHFCNEKDTGYLMLHGSGSIVEKLKELQKGYNLVTGCNDNHSWAGKPFKFYQDEIADFIAHDVVFKKFRQQHQIIKNDLKCSITATPEFSLE